ncbi:glycoside hydrolase [Tothia fuscella]|uniref:Glycoside hydrolase n=1 Tax=Tothia fuscella TaxID=1048955 RepID=A0A9P4NFE7_9PEZI|nr:glycoside hydrolase [Tothia fuscella]
MTILRNGIGSSVESPYDLMKSIQPQSPGSPTSQPKYDFDGNDNGQVWLSRVARRRGVQLIYADAGSAPGYMKNNNNDSFGGYLCGVTGISCTSGDWKQAYASYLVAYLKFYFDAGIAVNQVGFLNEPDLNTSYASMLSSGKQAAEFLRVFHPTLKASGLNTSIVCCDGGGWEDGRQQLEELKSAGAEEMLDIVSAHGYKQNPSLPFDTSKRVWQTEWADLNGPATLAWYRNGSSGEGLTWALNIQQAYAVSNVSAFLYWLGAGNESTNSALILLRKR